jgi:hypothetical protein
MKKSRFRALTATNAITPSKMLTFFNSGYKYSMDILQDVEVVNTIHQTNPSNLKDQRRNTMGIDVQTKHIYNLIEMGKNGTKLL